MAAYAETEVESEGEAEARRCVPPQAPTRKGEAAARGRRPSGSGSRDAQAGQALLSTRGDEVIATTSR